MDDFRHNNCKHWDECYDRGLTWWAECPDWEHVLPRDRVQEYADKLAAGCSCDNCLLTDTVECSVCGHLENWTGLMNFGRGK